MNFATKSLTSDEGNALLQQEESHFLDVKSAEIAPASLSKTISAFANTSGGELFIGIEEAVASEGKVRKWNGFPDQEAANAIFQVLEGLTPLGNNYQAEFLNSTSHNGLVLHITIQKTQQLVAATNGKIFVRRNAQSLPLSDELAIERLKYEKGIKSFEDELMNVDKEVVTNSSTVLEFLLDNVPTGEPEEWTEKQRVVLDGRPTVAGVLLYADEPQSLLPKRSAVKILRYRTKDEAERDYLVGNPITIEGPLYDLIYDAVDKIKTEIETIEKIGTNGLEKVQYPEEALHELLTNAVLHRDYSIAADVQVRIFDNRVEIESPGKLPGHVTVGNISKTQFARNPKIVRLINKFPDPPNKDVGEGINTAFEAMGKLRLKTPIFQELESSFLVTLRHQRLASPEQLVIEYLNKNSEITNAIGREITGIKSENSMKQAFYRLREQKLLEQTPKIVGKKPSWRKPQP